MDSNERCGCVLVPVGQAAGISLDSFGCSVCCGFLSMPLGQRGPGLGRGVLSGALTDPAARARQLVELMASSLLLQ